MVCENPDDPQNPTIYQPFECVLANAESFKYSDVKFVNYDTIRWRPCLDKKLVAQLKDLSRRMYLACKGNFYAR